MRHTKHNRIVALLLVMMLFVSTLSPAAFAEATASPEVPVQPTAEVSVDPTMEPVVEPTAEATVDPTIEPTAEPTAEPSIEPSTEEPARQTVREALAAGSYLYVQGSPMTLYMEAELIEPMYTVTNADPVYMVTGIIERDGLNSAEVWLLNSDYELIVAYAPADALPDTALTADDVQTMANERLSAMVFAVNGQFVVFVAEGEAVLPDEPPIEESSVTPLPENIPAEEEAQETSVPAGKQIGEYVLVTPDTRVFMDVDDSASEDYWGDMYTGQFLCDAAVQIADVKQDSLGRMWYVVNYLYGPDEGDGLLCEIIGTAHVLAKETADTGRTELDATDCALPTGFSMPMTLAFSSFDLRDNYGGVASYYADESGLHATTGHDNEYLQIARHDEYGTIYATPHYLKGETAYCLENTMNSPVVRDNASGPYEIVDLAGYRVTPGFSGYIFSDKTMHALAWVLRHTYPFMVVDRSDADNQQWSRVAGQFAIREVIKQLEGAFYVREYWYLEEFYRPYDYAPGVYLEYAKWLAAEALNYANSLPTINVYDKSVTASSGQYIGTASLYTTASQMRIPKSAGTITGNSGGDDWEYYYLYSGDTITVTSSSSSFSIPVEALPSADDEAAFFVGVTNEDIQKLLLPVYGDPYPVAEISLDFEVPHGSVRVSKTSAQAGAALSGAVFELLNSTGAVVQTQTTGTDGTATFSNLTAGAYSVREKSAPQGYLLNATAQNVTVTAGNTSQLSFTNDVSTSKIRIEKTDAQTGKLLPGAQFTVTRISGVSGAAGLVATLTTGADGAAETDWLPWGRYRVEETSAPDHYVNAGFSAEIDAHEHGKTYTFSVSNESTKGYIQLTKTDSLDQRPIASVQFEILAVTDSGEVSVGSMTTDENGIAVSEALPKGEYIVRESNTPDGYVSEYVELSATVKPDETTYLTATNEPIQGCIQVVKRDALTGDPLAGAEFTITRIGDIVHPKIAAAPEPVAVIVTDENGVATSPLLRWGRYLVEETSVPEHFVDNGFEVEVTIEEENLKTVTIEVDNEPTKGYIQVTKTDSLDQHPLEGVWFDIYHVADGHEACVGDMVTDENGIAISDPLPKGGYIVRESSYLDGYVSEVVELSATVRSDETTTLEATNEPIQGYIKVIKTDELTGELLAGAEFKIYRIGDISNPVREIQLPDAVITTGEDGIATSPLLRWGRYRVVESVVPEHFVDNGFEVEVEIAEENLQTVTIEVTNEPTKGFIQIVKTDSLDHTPIEGVQFDIYYADEYGDGLATSVITNKDGVALTEPLRKGVYKVVEHENPVGYVTELNQQLAIVWSDETTHLFVSNEPIQGYIEIIKTDELTGEPLAGAEFTIYRVGDVSRPERSVQMEPAAIIMTDENGIATSPLLRWGRYLVEETGVPEHYVDNAFSCYVNVEEENLKTVTIEVSNEPTKGFIRLTKTDRLNGNPIKGVKFEIFYNDQYGEGLATTMVTDADGVALSEPLRKGQYLVREQGATAGYVFETVELNATVKSDETTELTATNQPVQVQLLVMKRDTEETAQDEEQEVTEEAPLPTVRGDGVLTGAEFQIIAGDTIKDRQGNVLYRKDDVVVESIKTEGEYASALTPPLWPGLYKAVELTPPAGYHPSEKRITIDARSAAKVSDQAIFIYEGTKTNKIRYGAQAVVKILGANENEVDPERVEVPEADAEFLVYLKKAGSYENAREFERDHLVTNARGYAKTKALPYGVYTLEQIKGKDGYELKGKIDFMIAGEEDLNNPPPLTLSDRPILYRLKLTKVDAETGLPIILANTSFKLRNSEGNYVTQTLHYPNEAQIDTYITDDTGSVTLPQTLNWGMYTVEEVHSPTGYLALDEGFSIFVGSAGDTPDNVYEVNVKIPNEPVKGRILVQKKGLQFTGVQITTDAYGNEVHQPVYEECYLAGATFEVRAADDVVGGDGTIWYRQGDLVDTITTTDAGSDASKELPLGKYVLIETIAPAGYALDDTPHEVELTFMDNQTALVETSVSVGNTYLSAEIALTKEKEVLLTEEENGEVRQVITTAPGEGFVFGLFTDDDLHFDGGAIMAGSLVATGVTDAEGRLTFTGSFPHGHYTIRELSAPDGWTMSKDVYPVVLDPSALDAGESVIHVALDSPIHNALVYYAMTLTKTDITGAQTVPGARIEVSDDDGNIIYRATTEENGEIPDIFITPGRYTFREIIAPEGYALNEAEMTFEVDKDGNVTGNTMIRDDYPRVSVLKQDENGLPMAGVEFSLLDASGNTRMTAISDMNGFATFERIPYGKYTITETKPLPGYFRSDVSVEVTVDGSFVNPPEPLATITNHPMRIECIKVDNSGRTLPGVEFSLIDARTNTIVEIVTSDEQGRFVFDAIDYGSWIIRETRAPEGYMVMEDVHLEIGEDFVQPKPITFTNIPNHYEFMKVDDRNEPLAGVTFALEDEKGNVLRELVSGEDGIVHADNLTFGSYVIRETQALEGYKLTEETISFTIDENYVDPPELYCLVNEREPITTIIQTGVDFVMTPMTWIGAGLAVAGAAVMGLYGMSRKRKKRS